MNKTRLAPSLGLAVLLCMTSAFAQTYTFQTVNYPGDTFTQLLGLTLSASFFGGLSFAKLCEPQNVRRRGRRDEIPLATTTSALVPSSVVVSSLK